MPITSIFGDFGLFRAVIALSVMFHDIYAKNMPWKGIHDNQY
jgi:hypothetical protein